jgi:hypothetical protein
MYYRLFFYVPESALDMVKTAVFDAGAGKQGDYDNTCWQTLGQGQFRPLSGATPNIGNIGELEFVSEYKIEILCTDKSIRQAVEALKQSHPYEEPAYSVVKLEAF